MSFDKSCRFHALIFLLLGAFLCSCQDTKEFAVLEIRGERFRVEVVRTRQDQNNGLMHRKQIGSREGMLFVYPVDRRLAFWMKNTEIPLSLAYIDRNGQIIQFEDMQPLDATTIWSRISVRYALEVRQGVFKEIGVQIGDQIGFPENFR